MAKQKRLCKTISLPNGKRKYIYGKTKAELEENYIKAKAEVGAGIDISDHTTFAEFAQMWFDIFKRGKVSQSRELYIKTMLNIHILPVIGEYELRSIKPMMCSAIFSELTKSGLCKGTQHHVYCVLRSIFECALDNNLILKSPITSSVKPQGRPEKKREALTDAAVDDLLEKTRQKGTNVNSFCIIAVHTGMRLGEILGLRWEDVDMKNRIIHVRGTATWPDKRDFHWQGHTKTAAGMRSIPFGEKVYGAFSEIRNTNAFGYVFKKNGHPYTNSEAQMLRETIKKCSGATPHVLRHTAITRWVRSGMDPKECQYLAGHAKSSITMDIYTSYVVEDRFEASAKKIRAMG